MSDNKNIKNKWLHIRLDEQEHTQLLKLFSATTERKISRYARKVILSKPVTVNHRNQSLDEIMTVLIKLQNDLNGVANNYNQMVHKLHTLDLVPEINTWLKTYQAEKHSLHENIREVKEYVSQTAEIWLR